MDLDLTLLPDRRTNESHLPKLLDNRGVYAPSWKNAVNQLLTITGSVIRTVDHGTAKAGYTATFYMVLRD